MLNNVKDFGACGDGVSDDRVAIQTAIDEAVAHHKAGIWFPAGTYHVSRSTGASDRWSLDLDGVQDFMVVGEGPTSVVKLMDTAPPGNWHVFILRNNCRRVVFKDLVIDGNRTGLQNPDEQSQGIEVEPGTEDLWVDGCILRECFGDGMRIVGAPGLHVKRLRIENCLFQTNKRSGLAVQRALEQAIVTNCFFDSTVTDRCISFEPSGNDGPTDLLIQGCIIHHTNQTEAVSLSGIPARVNDDGSITDAQPLVRCKFSDNIILGGHITCTDVSQLTIQNNTVVVTEIGTVQRIPIEVKGGGDSLVITGNLLVNDDTFTKSVISLDTVSLELKDKPPLRRDVKRALIANNLCFARLGAGIQCLSGDEVAIQGNMVVATGACGNGILVRSETTPVDNISVRDNDVTIRGTGSWTHGITIGADPHPIAHVSVIGNSIRGAAKGIFFVRPAFKQTFTQTPVCALNRTAEDVAAPFEGIEFLPTRYLIVGGVASRGGTTAKSGAGRWLVGLGNPEGNVTGNVGDIFQRIDVPKPSEESASNLYVKTSGEGTVTGWTPK